MQILHMREGRERDHNNKNNSSSLDNTKKAENSPTYFLPSLVKIWITTTLGQEPGFIFFISQ